MASASLLGPYTRRRGSAGGNDVLQLAILSSGGKMISTNAISHIPYHAWDRDKSFEFFVETLGFYPHIRGNSLYCGMGDVLIELFRAEPRETEPTALEYAFGIEVSDLEATIAELEANGTRVLRPIFTPLSFYGRQAVIEVPGGPPIAIRDYRDDDGPHFTGWKPPE